LEETLAPGALEIFARRFEDFADNGSLSGRRRFGGIAADGSAQVDMPRRHQNEGNR
jgi:hypothetical protein